MGETCPGLGRRHRPERELESVDVRLVLVPVGPLKPVDGSSLCPPEMTGTKSSALMSGRCAEARTRRARLGRQLAGAVDGLRSLLRRVKLLDLAHQLITGGQERLPIPDRRQPARRDDLRLEVVRHHDVDVVAQHVARLGLDHLGCFEDVSLGGPPLLDRVQLLGGSLGEHVLEDLVKVAALGDGTLRCPSLIQDRHGCAIRLGLADRVGVDELAEDLVRPLLLAHDDRRAGEADPGTVGKGTEEVGVQVAGVRPVCLVDEDDDRVALVEETERLLLF